MDNQVVLNANEQFFFTEVKSLDGVTNFYIEGHISTTDSDKYNDIVSSSGQDDLVNQLKALPITMDLDHESFLEKGKILDRPKNLIPVAKIVEAVRTEQGTFVKAMLNSSHPKFDVILKSIKDGMLHSFSIAFNPVKTMAKSINGVAHRILDKIELLNVGITGIPVNPNATFAIVTKSFNIKMEEEKKIDAQVSELKSSLESKGEKLEEVQAELKSSVESIESKDSEISELKAKVETLEAEVEEKATEVKSVDTKMEDMEKSLNEIKSTIEGLKAPVHKGTVEVKSEMDVPTETAKLNGVINYIA